MRNEQLSESLKVRVPPSMKADLERRAGARLLRPADLVREALQGYLEKNRVPPAAPRPAAQEVGA
jgi:hypothetical protein